MGLIKQPIHGGLPPCKKNTSITWDGIHEEPIMFSPSWRMLEDGSDTAIYRLSRVKNWDWIATGFTTFYSKSCD